ncbi:hypothetical protein [Pseudomonas aeruginosa]|uniref:hypothetical protein n=1 Tax=Pseudomonas aeruginosa TaxID=287 RepID=UPI0029342E63|nr:hypothetical protein [Pseudomonas aeruginosa]WOA84900.1 hypothetical protein RX577_12850 [Pseudomonas aeruginosa]
MSSTQHQLIEQCATRLRGIVEALDNIHDNTPLRWSTDLDDVHSSAESLLALINDQAPKQAAQGLAGAALAQPSPKCATCNGSGQIVVSGPHYQGEFQPPEYETEPCDMCAQPSPAQAEQAEAERPEVVARVDGTDEDWFIQPEDETELHNEGLLFAGCELGRMIDFDRIVGALRYKAELYDEVWALVTGKGYMNVTTAISVLESERDAALARAAELELKLDKSDYAYDNDRIHMRGLAARAIARAKVFDDGSDGADAESVRSVVAILRELLAVGPAQAQHSVPRAWLDVQAERRRQITAEGWTPEHDDEHADGQMARAAACYALAGSSAPNDGTAALLVSLAWPWDEQWWKPSTPRRDLVKACALALAEIERLDRAGISQSPQPGATTASS